MRCFEYVESCNEKWAKDFLDGFSGVLIKDSYGSCNGVKGAIRARCWAYMRGKWQKVMLKGSGVKIC